MNDRLAFYMPPHRHINSYFEMIDCAKELGVAKIEAFAGFEFEKPNIENAKKIREYADSKNITFPCFSVYNCLLQTGLEESASMLKKYADCAKILGSPYLHHTLVAEYKYPEKVVPYEEELLKKGINLAKEVSEYSKSIGIQTIYEPQGFIFNGIKNINRLLSELDEETGLVADFGNIFQSGDSLEAFIRHFIDKIVHVHVKDILINDDETGLSTLKGKYTHSTEPMMGDANVSENITLLEELGYKGCYSFEFGNREEDTEPIKKALSAVNLLLCR